MKHYFSLILLMMPFILIAQEYNNISAAMKKMEPDEKSLYFFCRGTLRKSSLIAQKFNLADTNITHVGLGFFELGKPVIFHVSDNSNLPGTALRKDSLRAFLDTQDIYYFSIWQYKMDEIVVEKAKKTCLQMFRKPVWFDGSFIIANDDSLYCSEFCARVLNNLGVTALKFNPITIELKNAFFQSVLERNFLTYFPVDFFESTNLFKKVFEYRFQDNPRSHPLDP